MASEEVLREEAPLALAHRQGPKLLDHQYVTAKSAVYTVEHEAGTQQGRRRVRPKTTLPCKDGGQGQPDV